MITDEQLQELYSKNLAFVDTLCGEYGAMEVAGIMMAQSLTIYKSSLSEKEYNQIVELLKLKGLNKKINARSELKLNPYLGTRMYARDYLQESSVMTVNSAPITLQKVLLSKQGAMLGLAALGNRSNLGTSASWLLGAWVN
jgi:hypothetical protein